MLLCMSPVDLVDLKRMYQVLHKVNFVSARLNDVVLGLNDIYSSSFERVGVTVVTGGIKKAVHLSRSSEDLPEAFLVSGT